MLEHKQVTAPVVLTRLGEMQLARDKYRSEISISVSTLEKVTGEVLGVGGVVADDNHVSCTSAVFLDE